MDDASLQKSQIDEIVLVGGSTRIPKVQQLLKDFFEGKEPNKGVNPTRTRGCCLWCFCSVQGGILSIEGGDETKYILLLEVAPLTLGIGTVGYSNQEFSGEPLKLDAVNQRRLQSQTRRVV